MNENVSFAASFYPEEIYFDKLISIVIITAYRYNNYIAGTVYDIG